MTTSPSSASPGLTAEELALLLLLAGDSPAVSTGSTAAPVVLSVVRTRSHKATTGLVVTYSEGNGLGDAANPGDYAVATIGKHRKGKAQRLRSVAYDPSLHSATIVLARKIPGNPRLRLSIIGILPNGPYTTTV